MVGGRGCNVYKTQVHSIGNFVLWSQCHTLVKQFSSICLTDVSSITGNGLLRSKCDMKYLNQAKPLISKNVYLSIWDCSLVTQVKRNVTSMFHMKQYYIFIYLIDRCQFCNWTCCCQNTRSYHGRRCLTS